jgi:hypothetical protein
VVVRSQVVCQQSKIGELDLPVAVKITIAPAGGLAEVVGQHHEVGELDTPVQVRVPRSRLEDIADQANRVALVARAVGVEIESEKTFQAPTLSAQKTQNG